MTSFNMVREYAKQIGEADATHEGDGKSAARFMINRLLGYKKNKFKEKDIETLSKMIEAYVMLLQDAGVKVIGEEIQI